MKGIMNYVHEKALRMQLRNHIHCDLYCVRIEYTRLFTWLVLKKRYNRNQNHPQIEVIDGVVYNNIWIKYGLYDCLISTRIFKNLISLRYYSTFEKILKDYDVLSTHNLECHQVALRLRMKYPLFVSCTWHGTDIHTLPFTKSSIANITKNVIENADVNFFVSKNLLEISNKITPLGNKQVLYTGPSPAFYKFDDVERHKCHTALCSDADYIVGFVGNLIPVKNVMIIPEVLSNLTKKITGKKIHLVIVGDGPLRSHMEINLKNSGLSYSFLGNVKPSNMPRIMNGLDILILPSKNEGLPLVTLEALSCGIPTVGAKVGGIPEVIGDKNCFILDDNFVDRISTRMEEILQAKDKAIVLPHVFSWENAINKEISSYVTAR